MKKLNRPCPICFSKEGEVLHTQKFALPQQHILPNQYDVVSCPICGFVFADSPASQKIYDEFYQEMSKYEDKNTASGGGDKEYDLRRIEDTAQTIANFLNNSNLTILDIGCGNGGLLQSLKKKGYANVVGLDPSQVCVSNMKTKGIEAYQGGLFKGNPTGKTYDLIILSHVFEHIFDLQKATKGLAEFLKEQGCIYVETPDASKYSQFYITPYYYFDTEHINHFDKNALSNLFETQGYRKILSEEKAICVSENKMYPVVYSFFKQDHKPKTNILDKETLKQSILNYITLSQKDSSLNLCIQNLVETQQKVIVWGAGNYTFRILATTNLHKANIQFFVDSDSKKWGQTVLDKAIVSPQTLLDKNENCSILVLSALFFLEIKNQIEAMGMKNEVVF